MCVCVVRLWLYVTASKIFERYTPVSIHNKYESTSQRVVCLSDHHGMVSRSKDRLWSLFTVSSWQGGALGGEGPAGTWSLGVDILRGMGWQEDAC